MPESRDDRFSNRVMYSTPFERGGVFYVLWADSIIITRLEDSLQVRGITSEEILGDGDALAYEDMGPENTPVPH